MIGFRHSEMFLIALLGLSMAPGRLSAKPAAVDSNSTQTLNYQVTEGLNLNAFFRSGRVAAHLLLRSGRDPRILVAFPAGNSGVGLWFDHLGADATWRLDRRPRALMLRDHRGRPLYGINARATINAPLLSFKQAVLSNVRFLRDYQSVGRFPTELAAPMQVRGQIVTFKRDRLDGGPGYLLTIKVLRGRLTGQGIEADESGSIGLEILAVTGDRPLTPLDGPNLLATNAAADPNALNALRFLSYREKFLAGSWRFNTYFGRDTLMSVRLLMPVLQPAAAESGLTSVLARLSPGGEVAHEEGPSEFALFEHKQQGKRLDDAATLDYGMIDDDYMLAPVMTHYLLDHTAGLNRASAYLGSQVVSEVDCCSNATVGETLVRNLRFVVEQAKPFAASPSAENLVSIKPGRTTGQWRDSDEGLGRGRYAYDVNAVFIPAALSSIDRLVNSGKLDRFLTPADRTALESAGAMAAVWREKAPRLFAVSYPAAQAETAITSYATASGVDGSAAIASLAGQPLIFHALSLDGAGNPVPTLNSDEGFALLFTNPSPADLDTFVGSAMRPFPAGLMTDVGMLVANPVLADMDVQARFTRNHYHGAVVWSWQQALFAAGLERQLTRSDLPVAVRERLLAAQASLWRAIQASRALQSSELWSWAYADGHYVVAPFGAGSADVDESNAAQLWSTVYLSVQPPR